MSPAGWRKAHVVVFFIFVMSNAGGLLTPLGDPPLFLGFLRGVPFFWTLRLLPHWLFVNGLLLVISYVVDSTLFRREAPARQGAAEGANGAGAAGAGASYQGTPTAALASSSAMTCAPSSRMMNAPSR